MILFIDFERGGHKGVGVSGVERGRWEGGEDRCGRRGKGGEADVKGGREGKREEGDVLCMLHDETGDVHVLMGRDGICIGETRVEGRDLYYGGGCGWDSFVYRPLPRWLVGCMLRN